MTRNKKKIAILGSIGISIPPKKQGGIEWMVYYLTEELVKRGHSVLLFAPQNTKTSAELVPVCPRPVSEYKIPIESEGSRKLRIELSFLTNLMAEVLKRKNEIGVVFNHTVSGGIFAILEKLLKVPVFHVLHLPLYKELAEVFKKYNPRLISISDSQRKSFPKLNYVTTIYNGIDLKKIPFCKKPKDYFIFAGKIRPSKNPLAPIKAVKLVQKKLILVGKMSDPEYFKSEIKPSLTKDIVYLGEVNFSKIIELYCNANALLFPITWQESFGLVMIEAMACGTPVIVFDRASAREVIKDGETGFVVKNIEEMAGAIKKIDQVDRRECRKWVEKNFTVEKMVDEYEKIYYKILKEG
ncbi:glycosyltransferase family 4 protein [Patescibacteria group bacterium]|nr:glycosyltransferase family 4 protein [Patescibacteria group bacterium]